MTGRLTIIGPAELDPLGGASHPGRAVRAVGSTCGSPPLGAPRRVPGVDNVPDRRGHQLPNKLREPTRSYANAGSPPKEPSALMRTAAVRTRHGSPDTIHSQVMMSDVEMAHWDECTL
jgi:hypothetical protein